MSDTEVPKPVGSLEGGMVETRRIVVALVTLNSE
jgi:hypothetical protein